MRLATLLIEGRETAAIRTINGFMPMGTLNALTQTHWPTDMAGLIQSGQLADLMDRHRRSGLDVSQWFPEGAKGIVPFAEVRFAPLFRHPGKIWGIGLNYADHARDLDASAPTFAPASFMKPCTAIIGPGDPIKIPVQSEKTTAEAELGIVIGTRCKDVAPADWMRVVAGFTPILDMTAEDILRRNPRYLTLSKSFDTFFSFGPELLTVDEVTDVLSLTVETVRNGRVHAHNTVAHMTFTPDRLVAFHSRVMTLLPGDVISTGTPGASPIAHGDRIACRITGFQELENPVEDLKKT